MTIEALVAYAICTMCVTMEWRAPKSWCEIARNVLENAEQATDFGPEHSRYGGRNL